MLSINNASYALNFFCAIFFLLYLFGAFNPVDTNVYRVRDEIKCEEPVPCPKQSTESKTCAKEEELQSQLGEIKSLDGEVFKGYGVTGSAMVDKVAGGVAGHTYQYAYQKYLSMVRELPLKFVEIGLGCGMPYGEGHSYFLWRGYMPKAKIVIFEYVAACANAWKARIDDPNLSVMAGYDQSKIKDLNRLIADHGPFDVVVDDGGHRPEQQKTSFIHLFPHVKPGGLYFLEDIHTAWMDNFGGDSNGNLSGSTMEMIQGLVAELSRLVVPSQKEKPNQYTELALTIRSIDCFEEICVFRKK